MKFTDMVEQGELTIVRQFRFDYAHHLPNYEGKCCNTHGHTGIGEVEVRRGVLCKYKYPGMVMDFHELDQIIKENIIEVLDHKYLNTDIDDFVDVSPTAENIALWIAHKLYPLLGSGLVRVKFSETPDSWAEFLIYEDNWKR